MTSPRSFVLVLVLVLGTSASGCASAVVVSPAPAPSSLAWHELGRSEEDRPIRLALIGDLTAPAETVLLLGGVHGSAPAGPPLCEAIAAEIAALPAGALAGRRIAIIPDLNPDGLARGTRRNARRIDLNRDFPTRDGARGAPRARETRALLAAIERLAPARIVSIHQPLRCVNWDGPAEPLARAAAARCGYPARASIGYPTPGSLGTWAGRERAIPTITHELPPGTDHARHLRETRAAILHALFGRDLAPADRPATSGSPASSGAASARSTSSAPSPSSSASPSPSPAPPAPGATAPASSAGSAPTSASATRPPSAPSSTTAAASSTSTSTATSARPARSRG